jgi:hypothetical protein
MEAQKIYSSETVSLPDLIAWAKSAGIHPSFIGSLLECTYHPISTETHQHLEEANEYLARAQECFSAGDRSKSEYWELMVYEAVQKINLMMSERIKI